MTQDTFQIISLLDLDADTDGIHGWLDKHLFIFVSTDGKRVQQDLLGFPIVISAILNTTRTREIPYPDSTSGVLCRSAISDEKLSRHNAAVNEDRTAVRYGRSVFDYIKDPCWNTDGAKKMNDSLKREC